MGRLSDRLVSSWIFNVLSTKPLRVTFSPQFKTRQQNPKQKMGPQLRTQTVNSKRNRAKNGQQQAPLNSCISPTTDSTNCSRRSHFPSTNPKAIFTMDSIQATKIMKSEACLIHYYNTQSHSWSLFMCRRHSTREPAVKK